MCPGTGRRLHRRFWAAVHGGLGRARRPRGVVSSFRCAADDWFPAIDRHRSRLTQRPRRAVLRGRRHGLRDPTRTAVARVRFAAALARTARLTSHATEPSGRASYAAAGVDLPRLSRESESGRPKRATGRVTPGTGHLRPSRPRSGALLVAGLSCRRRRRGQRRRKRESGCSLRHSGTQARGRHRSDVRRKDRSLCAAFSAHPR